MKKFTAFLVALTILSAPVAPTRAEAAIGIVTRFPLAIVAGGVTIAAGAGSVALGLTCDECSIVTSVTLILVGVGAAIVGLVLLDERGPTKLVYRQTSEHEAALIGLTPLEREEFNSSLEEINAVAQQVGRELALRERPTLEDSRVIWERYRTRIPTEAAFTAAGKVSASWLRSLETGR